MGRRRRIARKTADVEEEFVVMFVCPAQVKVKEEHQALLAVIKRNTELLQASSRLLEEKRSLKENIRIRQTEMVT